AWAESTLASGAAVTGYLVQRYDQATLTAQTVLASCDGRISATTCTENGVPAGQWRYSVTPVIGTSWRGAESPLSSPVTSDTTSPVNAISLSDLSGDAVQVGDTVYYRGLAPGSFTLTNAVTDSGSGPADSQTSALVGGAGWTHSASTVATPSGGPFVSAAFAWAAGTTSTVIEAVTGHDVAGNAALTTLTFVDDSAAPSGVTVDYPDGVQPAQSVVVTLGNGTDTGSGIAGRQLQRSSATMSAGTCDVFSGFTDLGPAGPASPYVDLAVVDGSCYRYRFLVTDRLGNQAVATSPHVAKVDSASGGPPLRSAASYSVLGATGVANTLGTTVSGDLGLSTSGAIVGFPPGIVGGATNDKNAAAAQAQVDLGLAYADAAGRTPTDFFAGDQIGKTFHAGVHSDAAAFANTGTMTLDGDGDPNALFIFQINAAMGPAAGSNVVLVNGATASHVFWQVNGAVTLGANASLSGTVLANGAITLGNGAVLFGRALAVGAVTMANNTIRFTAALPPTVTIDGAGPIVTKDTTPTITGTSNAAPGTIATVRVAGQVLTTAVQPDGTWSVTAGQLTAGTWTVVASVRDGSGNNGAATKSLTVEVNPDPVSLAGAGSYSVLGGTGVTSTGATSLAGDLGLSPAGAITGFPPGVVSGATHDKDANAAQARADLVTAYNELDSRAPVGTVVGDLGGQTFHAGIFHTSAALALTGTVTLDAEGDPTAIFIFQGDAAFDTAASAHVVLAGGALAANVYWQIQGAVGTGASTTMAGTILTAAAINFGASTQLAGRALSLDAVTMADTVVTTP
ncbi:MAG: hypothetical protein QOD98_2074, partial [Nocardioidaceae bacterium]|nr:hypothetical protein [Nocardioidaceae bacterium]